MTHPPRRDGGFSLIEVVVALGILTIVVVALLPQLVVGIKSTGTARLITQTKGVAQGELERMRNLPYHVSPEAGDYLDVLDYYYRDLAAPTVTPVCTGGGGYASPQLAWAGYVSESASRCDYEPAAGAFYRTVRELPATAGTGSFTTVVNTQFLSGATPPQPVTPPSGYDTQTTNGARPASAQVGVTATVLYTDRAVVRPTSTYTQISDQPSSATRVTAEASVAALDVGSVTTDNGPVTLSAGLLNTVGALTYASTANANLSATSAGLATGEQASGASQTVAAPPTTTATAAVEGPGSLLATGCDLACWGSTRLDVPALSATGGLPNAGSPTAPMQALLTDTTNNGISFGNSPAAGYRPGLRLLPPLVRLDPDAVAAPSGVGSGCTLGATGTSSYLTAGGYLRTTAEDAADPSVVETCAVARTSSLSLFPTEFAPRGVVLVELRRAAARCLVEGSAHTASTTHDYEAEVKYWDGSGYQTAGTVTPATTADPLEAVDLATTGVGGSKVLGDYIASWSALTGAEVSTTSGPGQATVKVPGVITIASQPVRPDSAAPDGLDATSVVSMAVGAVTCSAEDTR